MFYRWVWQPNIFLLDFFFNTHALESSYDMAPLHNDVGLFSSIIILHVTCHFLLFLEKSSRLIDSNRFLSRVSLQGWASGQSGVAVILESACHIQRGSVSDWQRLNRTTSSFFFLTIYILRKLNMQMK